MKWLKNIKLTVIITVGIIALLALLFNIKTIGRGLLYTIGGLIAGLAIGYWVIPNPAKIVEKQVYLTRDTCLTYIKTATCNLTWDDSLAIYKTIRKGKTKNIKPRPKIIKVSKKDSIYTKSFSTSFDEGLIQANIKFNIVSKDAGVRVDSFELDYKLDTLEIQERYTKTVKETIILEPEHKETIKYLPVETPYVEYGISSGLEYVNNWMWKIGPYYRTKKGVEISVRTGFENKKITTGEINLQIPIIKKDKQ